MKRWWWQVLGVAAVSWLLLAVVRAAMGVRGHMGLAGVLGFGAVMAVLGLVGVVMFRYCATMIAVIWRERWDWVTGLLRPREQRQRVERTWHSDVDGVMSGVTLVIFEVGLYWFALLSGYGVLLCLYILGSLAWFGDVALTTVEFG
ncbi:MAG: hypothetical protein HOV79_26010 [Hamadaea sp.]|nr:hypothetical protein [Hamadaea sp.]